MKTERPQTYLVVLYLSDMLAVLLSLVVAQRLRETLAIGLRRWTVGGGINLGIAVMAVAAWTMVFRLWGAYDPDRILRVSSEIQRVVGAVAAASFVLAGGLYLTFRGLSRLLFAYFCGVDLLLTLLFRILERLAVKRWGGRRTVERRVLLVGAGAVGADTAELLSDREWMDLQVVGFLDDDPGKIGTEVANRPVLGTLDAVIDTVQKLGVTDVIITLPQYAYERLQQLVARLADTNLSVGLVPDLLSLAYLQPGVGRLGDMPLIVLKEPVLAGVNLVMKRILDLTVGALALLFLWPVMLAVAILIRADSPGPVLFRQKRVGWHGDTFTMYKFRSMVTGADQQIDVVMDRTEDGRHFMRKTKDDPRVTRLGRLLRRWSLDELPQFLNVVKGNMSLVGPRPELPSLVREYEPWQRKRLAVPPGMTGWWQVSGRSDSPLALSTEADLYYVRNYSLFFDLQIIFRTVGAVVSGRGAY